MLTKEKFYTYLAAVMTTLLEEHPRSIPESSIYILFNMDMDEYQKFMKRALLVDLLVVANHQVSLSGKGVEVAKELQEAISKTNNQPESEMAPGSAP